MNKEQFKKSILEVVDYYVSQITQANIMAKEAQMSQNKILFDMAQNQAQIATYAFEQGMEALSNEIFPDVELEDEEENEG